MGDGANHAVGPPQRPRRQRGDRVGRNVGAEELSRAPEHHTHRRGAALVAAPPDQLVEVGLLDGERPLDVLDPDQAVTVRSSRVERQCDELVDWLEDRNLQAGDVLPPAPTEHGVGIEGERSAVLV